MGMRLVSALLDLFAPRACLLCDGPLTGSSPPLCPDCLRRLPWWRIADGCPRCGSRMPLSGESEPGLFEAGADGCPGCLADGSALHACHALLRYEGPARLWVPGFKRRHGPFGPPPALAVAIAFLARQLADQLWHRNAEPPDRIVPVPLHPRRRRERGFNHAESIARPLARALGRPCQPELLVRIRPTLAQASLRGEARRDNVRSAFRSRTLLGPGLRIGLVDDVLTTGQTLEAAAEALLEAGAGEVVGLTIAATLPPRRMWRADGVRDSYPPR